MYEEKPKREINWKSLILKLLILALIFFAIFWLFSSKKNKKENADDKVFSKNITNMKDVAKDYFSDELNLPTKTGERNRITLQDMLNKELIVKFTDKDGHYCDVDNSYAQATKTGDDEYQLKVLLSCEDQTDYIVESLDSLTKEEKEQQESKEKEEKEEKEENNNSEETEINEEANNKEAAEETSEENNSDNNSNTSEPRVTGYTTKTVKRTEYYTQYEFKQAETHTNTTYSCPEGYALNDKTCSKAVISSKIDATPTYGEDQELVTDALVNDSGDYTVYANPIETKGETTYKCPDGYITSGTGKHITCTKVETIKPNVTTSYSCNTGYKSSGNGVNTKCTKTTTSKATAKATYSCPNGTDKKTGSNATLKCYNKVYKAKLTTYKCPKGYISQGSGAKLKCYRKITKDATPKTVANYKGYARKKTKYGSWYYSHNTSSTTPLYSTTTVKYQSTGRTSKYVCSTSSCPGVVVTYNYKVYKRSISTNFVCRVGTNVNGKCYTYSTIYSCPNSSYDRSGKICTAKVYKNKIPVYKCPNGYKEEGSGSKLKCYKYSQLKTNKRTTYSCANSSAKLNGTTCSLTVNVKATENKKYSCPTGYTAVGTGENMICKKTTNINEEEITEESTYTCPDGYNSIGSGKDMVCSKVVSGTKTYYCADADATLKDGKCYKKTQGGITGYTCPEGYSLDGKYCYKTEDETIDATENVDTNTTYKYTWSNNETLDGWEFTGNTREVPKDVYDTITTPNTGILDGDMSILDIVLFSFVILGFTYLIYMTIKSYKNEY